MSGFAGDNGGIRGKQACRLQQEGGHTRFNKSNS